MIQPTSGVAITGARSTGKGLGQNAPVTKNNGQKYKKVGKLCSSSGKEGKNQESKGGNWEDSSTLPLLTGRTGNITATNIMSGFLDG